MDRLTRKTTQNDATKEPFAHRPAVDQGSQFSGFEWIQALKNADIKKSMDGKGRWVDNRMIERL